MVSANNPQQRLEDLLRTPTCVSRLQGGLRCKVHTAVWPGRDASVSREETLCEVSWESDLLGGGQWLPALVLWVPASLMSLFQMFGTSPFNHQC